MSEQRKYTLDEIDAMRRSVRVILALPLGSGRDFDARAEDQLRTYMLAGISPDELIEKAKKVESAWFEREHYRIKRSLAKA